MKYITFTDTEGNLVVVKPMTEMFDNTSRTRVKLDADGILALDATEAEIMGYIQTRSLLPGATNAREIDEVQVPTDSSYRNAWEADGTTKIKYNMPKARNLHRDKMREARSKRFKKLDAEYNKADEQGDAVEKARIGALRQQLRDVTALPAIDNAASINALKAVWPGVLDQ